MSPQYAIGASGRPPAVKAEWAFHQPDMTLKGATVKALSKVDLVPDSVVYSIELGTIPKHVTRKMRFKTGEELAFKINVETSPDTTLSDLYLQSLERLREFIETSIKNATEGNQTSRNQPD
jgi:hypothetical protein